MLNPLAQGRHANCSFSSLDNREMDICGQEDRMIPYDHVGKQVPSPQPWQGSMSSDMGLLWDCIPMESTQNCNLSLPFADLFPKDFSPQTPRGCWDYRATNSIPPPSPEMAEGHRPCLSYRPRRVESPGKARDAAGARPT